MSEPTEDRSHAEEIKEIWKLFKETDRKFRETDRKFQETDRKFQETEKLLSEKFRETDRKFQEMEKLLSEKFRETDRKFQEMEKLLSEKFRETRELVNSLTDKWGRFVEGLVAPGVIRMFQERGINIEQTFQRAGALSNGKKMEIDVLCVNDRDILAIEVKSTLGVEDVDEHIGRLKSFKRFFPQYRDSNLLGGVAGIVFNGESDKYAYKQGLFVIGQTGETVHILNDARFKPKSW
jgi:hypothetical protein